MIRNREGRGELVSSCGSGHLFGYEWAEEFSALMGMKEENILRSREDGYMCVCV